MRKEPDKRTNERTNEPQEKDFLRNVSKPVQLFIHTPGMAVLCVDIGLHERVEVLKKLLRYELQKIATFYTARNIKLKTELSFDEQGLESECNIYIRFHEGLVGGSANYNPQDPTLSSDYEQGPGYTELYQSPGYAEIPQGPGYPGAYPTPRYQTPFPPNLGNMHINQQMTHEPHYVNQFQHYGDAHHSQRYVHPNVPPYYPPHFGYGHTGGHAHRGNITSPRQGGRGAPLRFPGVPQNQYQKHSTAHRSPILPVEKDYQQNASTRTPSPRLASNITTTSSGKKPENVSVELTNIHVDMVRAEGSSNLSVNYGSAKVMSTSSDHLKSDQNVTKILKGKDHFDISAETAASSALSVPIDDTTLLKDGEYGNVAISKMAETAESSALSVPSDDTCTTLLKDGEYENVGITKSAETPESSALSVPSDDIASLKEGVYGDITITKSSKKSDQRSHVDYTGGLQENSAELFLRSSSSKVFSPGLASRDSGDIFPDSFSSASTAFAPTNVETTTSLTGKPVIQASDKESSVTDVMNHQFKSLTTGDFMLILKCRQFQEIPTEILRDQRCKHTTKINISSNRLRDFPKYLDIDHFPSMKILDASKNKLVDLPANIAEFRGMENLDISHNQCRIFPEVIAKLKHLKILKVNNNSIEYVHLGLGFYKELEILRLEGNKLTRIPDDIANLESLQYLNISDNRLDDFPQVICQLKNLQFLYMSSNKIKEVPHNLYMNESLEVVQVDKNPIVKPPPDVLARPIQEIRRYCKEIVAGRFKDDRILILVQGSSNSGKSSVCSALCSDVTQIAVKPTEGIEERSAVIRDINVIIREFSGDAHYRGLAEIFIVQNALYIVTVDLKKYSTNVDILVWFDSNVWQYLKKIVDRQTVFIIGTHGDQVPHEAVDLLDSLMKRANTALQNENKLLHLVTGFVNNTIDSFDHLKDEVTKCLLDRNQFPERGQYRPVHWKNAEPALLAYRKVNQATNAQQKTALWVPFKTVSDLLMQNGFESPEDMKTFLRYLRCVGIILWHERRHLLKTFVCANPALLIKALKIILSKDHKEAFMKAYKPRWRLNPVPEDDVTYVIACQMYNSRGCINMESVRRILKGVVEDKEDINMIVTTVAHFDVCKEVNICTPDIKVVEIQEGLDAGVTLQEEAWPQLATQVLQPNSPFNDDDLPQHALQIVVKNLGKDWLVLSYKLGFSKTEINSASAQFSGKLEAAILHMLMTWKQRAKGMGMDVKKELMAILESIKREDLTTTIMEYDRHTALALHLRIVLPTWKKLKHERIHIFPVFLKNGETQMSNYWQVVLKILSCHQNFCFNLGSDQSQTIDEVFLKCCEVIVEKTLSHQIWHRGILTEGIDPKESGVLYYFQFKCTGEHIQVEVSAASNSAIPQYCEEKLNEILVLAVGRACIY